MGENQILSKLKIIKDKGNIKDLDFLFECLSNKNSDIAKESFNILVNIKVKAANKIIIEKIKLEKNKEILNQIISICWQSGLDFSDYLLLFFNIVINEDLPIAIEAMSVIENILSNYNYNEEHKKEGINLFNKYVKKSDDEVKTLMIKDFINTI